MTPMIGQKKILSDIYQILENDAFPRFSIIVGSRGSGKYKLAQWICEQLHSSVIDVGTKVDDIRQMIQNCYKLTSDYTYIIRDADGMSLAAKNALLKVTEEPPNNAHFIMTLKDVNQTLETIRSRGTVFMMDPYTPLEIESYIRTYMNIEDHKVIRIYQDLCETPGDVQLLNSYNVSAFDNYIELVVDNVATVSGANAFKIADKLSLKNEDDKYDLELFFKAFIWKCVDRAGESMKEGSANGIHKMDIYLKWARITSSYLRQLGISGINKTSTFDCWLLDIRKETFENDSAGC